MPLDNDKAPEKIVGRNPQHELKDLPNLGLAGDKLYGPQDNGSWIDYTAQSWLLTRQGEDKTKQHMRSQDA